MAETFSPASAAGLRRAITLETSDQTFGGTRQLGETPSSPDMETVVLSPDSGVSDPVIERFRANRVSNTGIREFGLAGGRNATGQFRFDCAIGDYDKLLQWAMMASASVISNTTGATTINAAIANSALTDPAIGGTMFSGFSANDVVAVTGFGAGADGPAIITSVESADEIRIYPAVTADVTGDGDEIVNEKGSLIARAGSLTPYGLTFEEWFSNADTAFGVVARGLTPGNVNFTWNPGAVATASVQWTALDWEITTSRLDATPNSPADNPYLTARFGAITIDGVGYPTITRMSLQVAQNNALLDPTVGVFGRPGVGQGEAVVTGSVTAYLRDKTFLDALYNGTTFAITMLATEEGSGDRGFQALHVPRCQFTGARPSKPREGGITVEIPFEAEYDTTAGYVVGLRTSNDIS